MGRTEPKAGFDIGSRDVIFSLLEKQQCTIQEGVDVVRRQGQNIREIGERIFRLSQENQGLGAIEIRLRIRRAPSDRRIVISQRVFIAPQSLKKGAAIEI